MGRLSIELLERVELFSHRVMDVVDELDRQKRPPRVIDQLTGSSTAVGANVWESAEALSAADLCKTLGIALKELGETRYWLRFVWKRGWLPQNRLTALEAESVELTKILGSIIARTRRRHSPKPAAVARGRD